MQEQKTHTQSQATIAALLKSSKNLNLLQISENGEVKLNTSEKLDPEVIQQILDFSHLRAKAYDQAQKQIEQANNQQALIIGFILALSLFTITFTLSRSFKSTQLKAQSHVISITV